MITVEESRPTVPIVVFGDGDILMGVRGGTHAKVSTVEFHRGEPGEIGRDVPPDNSEPFLMFAFHNKESLDVLVDCLKEARKFL